jgi:hypothetical protein
MTILHRNKSTVLLLLKTKLLIIRPLYWLSKKLDWYVGGLKGRIYSSSVRLSIRLQEHRRELEQERSNIDD